MTITTHIYYKTSDGKEFDDKLLAEVHEHYTIQKDAVEKAYQDKVLAINWERFQITYPKIAESMSSEPEHHMRNEGYENTHFPVGRD